MWPFARRPRTKMSKEELEALRIVKAKAAQDRADHNARLPVDDRPRG